ncbi:MAG: hypothetical protein LUG13_07950 [Oscillospiraceae bacterium]|nr:hypothetical protein [Oscillospiraceae bacterium]
MHYHYSNIRRSESCSGFGSGCRFGDYAFPVTLCGTVSGLTVVADVLIAYTVNGSTFTVVTDANGFYCIMVPRGSNVTITPPTIPGFTIERPQYLLFCVECPLCNLDFVYTAVAPVPVNVTLSGTVFGLADVAGVTIQYTINGVAGSTVTDAFGNYSIVAPEGADVVITAATVAGFTVMPTHYSISDVTEDISQLDFYYLSNTAAMTLTRATSVLPAYMAPPNTWPLHGSILPDLYMLDRILIHLPPLTPLSVKWAPGIQDIAFFTSGGGLDITGSYQEGIPVGSNGSYTVYAQLSGGFTLISTIQIDHLRDGSADMPYLLIDFATAQALQTEIPGIEQFTLYFMQGGGAKLASHYELYEDINMAGQVWEPLGVTEGFDVILDGFRGSLHGNDHSIQNLTLGSGTSDVHQGLFGGLVDGATIQNLGLVDCTVTSTVTSGGFAALAGIFDGGTILLEHLSFRGAVSTNVYAGGILGYNVENTGALIVRNCTVTASINCFEVGGGIMGEAALSSTGAQMVISDCDTFGTVTTRGDTAAGVLGICVIALAGSVCSISNCVNTMTVLSGGLRVAGIVGLVVSFGTISISSCLNTGALTTAVGSGAGGICATYNGYPNGSMVIQNCYNTGDIVMHANATTIKHDAGGILGGGNLNDCVVLNSYNTGNVVANEIETSPLINVGGISGEYGSIQNNAALCQLVSSTRTAIARISPTAYTGGTNLLLNNLAYDGMQVLINGVQKSPLNTGSAGTDGISTSAADLTMQSTYEVTLGWDFTNVWRFGNGAYTLPVLQAIPAELQPTTYPPYLV